MFEHGLVVYIFIYINIYLVIDQTRSDDRFGVCRTVGVFEGVCFLSFRPFPLILIRGFGFVVHVSIITCYGADMY